MFEGIKITDWLMVLITLIYVIATIRICHYNKKTIDTAEKQLSEMQKEFNEQKKARVIVYFKVIRQNLLCFVIENVGFEPAFNVNVEINDNFINELDNDGKKVIGDLSHSNMYIASKQQFIICFGTHDDFNKISQNKVIIKITYNQVEETTEIDLSNYGFTLIYDTELGDISKSIEKLRKTNEKFVHEYIKLLKNNNDVTNSNRTEATIRMDNIDDTIQN